VAKAERRRWEGKMSDEGFLLDEDLIDDRDSRPTSVRRADPRVLPLPPPRSRAVRPGAGVRAFRLVVGVDFSPLAELALDSALRFAAPYAGSEVHAVHVEPARGSLRPRWHLALVDAGTAAQLDAVLQELERYGAARLLRLRETLPNARCRIVTHARLGAPAAQIARMASDLDADLVVVGSHGRPGPHRRLLGSVAEAVVGTAPCPVYVARPKSQLPD
jgi:nucleotide-binding universal stress UspA family protein